MGAQYADGSTTAFGYDAAGRLVAAEESLAGRIDFTYDGLDRLIQEVTPQGTVAYTYDALGRRTTLTANGAAPVSYQYDAASRLTQVAQAGLVVGLAYDEAGRRTGLTYPNGTSTAYGYDAASRLTALLHQGPAGVLESLSYTYDAAGNRTSLTRSSQTATLLPPAVQAAYDAANQQIQFNSLTPNQTFDANGNLTSVTEATGTTTYTWDPRNRLVAINGPGISASFVYDALGRRVRKTSNGVTTEYLYDGNDIVQELGGGAVGASYIRSRSPDEAFVRSATSTEYYHGDALGSVLALTGPQGTVQSTYSYEAFGRATASGASTNLFQYTGRENDATGLYYYRYRYYDPSKHRFIAEDPIRASSMHNFYAYAANSPLGLLDPFGLYEEDVHRDLTYCLARHAGLSASAANGIASADQGVDDDWWTGPISGGYGARRNYHFTTPSRRADMWGVALEGGVAELGMYLHALQDSYAHEDYGPVRGHAPWHAPDKTYTDPQKANRMARDTYDSIRKWMEARTGISVPDQWEEVRNQVDRFNRARTVHEKRKGLLSCGP